MSKKNFYCQKICGSDSFNIDDYNKTRLFLEIEGKTEAEINAVLHPPKCQEQCASCIRIVQTRNKATALRLKRRF